MKTAPSGAVFFYRPLVSALRCTYGDFGPARIIYRMKSLNLNDIDPAELMPTPDVPESYGPRNAGETRIHELVSEALDADDGQVYETVDDLIDELRKGTQPKAG